MSTTTIAHPAAPTSAIPQTAGMRRLRQRLNLEEAREHYHKHGWYLAKNVLPPDLLNCCQYVLEEWTESMVQKWLKAGLIKDPRTDLDFRTRFNTLWIEAGKPNYPRSPRKPLVDLCPQEMYTILRHHTLVDLAELFLNTEDLISHTVWNSRPKTPDATFTDTPWHQDGQYFRNQAHLHIMTMWFPLHDVSETDSCLAVAPDFDRALLYENFEYPENGFVGIKREEAAKLPTLPVPMQKGDVLVFPQLTPHRALSNSSGKMRWSMDMRYVNTRKAMPPALDQGLIVRSDGEYTATGYEEWHAKWTPDVTW
jgi:phytanoyl-CoA hydroxylase